MDETEKPNVDEPQTPPPEPPKKARLEGSVVSLTGAPVPRAQLRLQMIQSGQLENFTATTDDAGKFVFENVEPGLYNTLTAQRPGFVQGRYGARSATSPGAPLQVEPGAALKGLTITMTPQGVISGRITDSNGDPVQNVQVTLLRRGYQRGVRQLLASNSASTNDQGDYRIANQIGRAHV